MTGTAWRPDPHRLYFTSLGQIQGAVREHNRAVALVQRWRNTARDLRVEAATNKVASRHVSAGMQEAMAAVFDRCADELAAVLGLAEREGEGTGGG
ncbi:MAG TPA: hypothetical protein VIK99_01220 [Thermaerobacter sp.]